LVIVTNGNEDLETIIVINILQRAESTIVHGILQDFYSSNKIVAAICAAPLALKAAKIGLLDRTVTSNPLVKDEMIEPIKGYKSYSDSRVVVDGNLITSRAPGTSFEFAFAVVEELLKLRGSDCGAGAKEGNRVIAEKMLLPENLLWV
ncbi:Protein deglycase DJ-1zDJ-1, partial [Blyttiomyces sp. JEL0837]